MFSSVQSEKARLSKLAVEQEPSLRDAAAQALEPTLHDLLKQQRLEVSACISIVMNDLEVTTGCARLCFFNECAPTITFFIFLFLHLPPQVAQQAESLATAHRESTEAHARSLAQALQQLKQEVHAELARELEERRRGWTQDLAHALVREYDEMKYAFHKYKCKRAAREHICIDEVFRGPVLLWLRLLSISAFQSAASVLETSLFCLVFWLRIDRRKVSESSMICAPAAQKAYKPSEAATRRRGGESNKNTTLRTTKYVEMEQKKTIKEMIDLDVALAFISLSLSFSLSPPPNVLIPL